MPPSRRLALLVALLPPLLVAGVARGVVVCVEADGHLRIESAASGCCTGPGAAVPDGRKAVEGGEPGCGPCSDIRMAMPDPRPSKRSDGLRPPADAPSLLPPAPPGPAASLARPRSPRPLRDRVLVPPRLRHLRSVALRC